MSRPRDRFLFGEPVGDEVDPQPGDDVDPHDVYGDYVEPDNGLQDDEADPNAEPDDEDDEE